MINFLLQVFLSDLMSAVDEGRDWRGSNQYHLSTAKNDDDEDDE